MCVCVDMFRCDFKSKGFKVCEFVILIIMFNGFLLFLLRFLGFHINLERFFSF